MQCLLLLIAVIAYANAVAVQNVLVEEWKSFKLMHSKVYVNRAEESSRYQLFLANRHLVAKHNQKFARKEVSYQMGINQFSDMTSEEFLDTMTSQAIYGGHGQSAATFIGAHNVELPAQTDWRAQGAVTPVKNQGQCGSCWSFSSTGALEGQHFRKNNKLVSLSEQNLVDCTKSNGNHGCNGGWMNTAFDYIRKNGGIDTEETYPYTGTDDQGCKFSKSSIGATCTGFMSIQAGDEEKLMNAVATVGPIAVAIQVTASFQAYHGDVYYEPACDPTKLNHAVLVVGYGTDEETKQDYWLVKNSWGRGWGLDGYIKMARNKNNNCGIVSAASYPLV
ncbi:unnamed protein product [Diamesa tonsa]